jgi:hypothetical protein
MKKEEIENFKKFRSGGMKAINAFFSAKTLCEFKALEEIGQARIKIQYEEENYFHVFGEPESEKERRYIVATIEKFGLWYVKAEVKCPCCGQWEHVEGIGMIIANDPADPYENEYAIDLMQAAIDKVTSHKKAA